MNLEQQHATTIESESALASILPWVDRAVLATTAAIGAFYLLAALGALGQDPLPANFSNFAWTAIALAAGCRCLWSARRCPDPSLRVAWLLLAAAALCWFGGMVYLFIGELTVPDFVSRPTPANYLFLALAPLFGAGVLFLRLGGAADEDHVRRLSNLAAIFCAAITGALVAYLKPLLELDVSLELVVFSIADPAAFVTASVFTLAALWMASSRPFRMVYWLLLVSILLHTVANLAYFYSVTRFPDQPTWRLDGLWVLALAFQYLAAVAHDSLKPTRQDDGEPAERSLYNPMEALLAPGLIIAMVALIVSFPDHVVPELVLPAALPLFLFAVLIGFRSWWAARHERRLLDAQASSARHHRRVLSASPAIIFELKGGADGIALSVSDNAGNVFPGPLRSFDDLVDQAHPVDRQALTQQLRAVRQRGASMLQYRVPRPDGGTMWAEQRMVRYHIDEAPGWEVFGSIVDVTQTKRLEARVMNRQRLSALGRLAGGIAHDFNNLLTSILGFTAMARDRMNDDDPGRELLDQVEVAADKAVNLTRRLLAFGRRQPLALTVVDVNRTVAELMGMLSQRIGPDTRIEFEPSATAVKVSADPGQLEQVIMNLVINAAEAVASEGVIRITVDEVVPGTEGLPDLDETQGDSYALIRVSDNGVGMSAAVQAQIFDPFFTTKSGDASTGLGLATVHGIVRQHHGIIEVKSAEGAGSTFSILLPATTDPLPAESSRPSPTIPEGTETILVVDDDVSITDLIQRVLSPAGYRVLAATNIPDALALAEASAIDLLLADVSLPVGDGHELAEKLTRRQPATIVVYMSGHIEDPRLRSRIRASGAPYLDKPLELGTMARLLRELLDRKRATGIAGRDRPGQ